MREPRYLLLGVSQPMAWALAVRNSPVAEISELPPVEMIGAYAILYANGPYNHAAAAFLNSLGVGAPSEGEESAEGVVAVGRIHHLGPPTATLPGARWCRSGMGVWLRGVFPVAAALQRSVEPGAWVELSADEVLAPRRAYHEAVAACLGLVSCSPAERFRLSPEARAARVEAAFNEARRCGGEAHREQLRRVLEG